MSMSTWQEKAEKSLKGKPLSKLAHKTLDEISISPVFQPAATSANKSQASGYPALWGILQQIEIGLDGHLTPDPIHCLENGASGLFVKVSRDTYSSPILSSSFDKIYTDMINIRFSGLDGCSENLNNISSFFATKYKDKKLPNLNFGLDPLSFIAQTGGHEFHLSDLQSELRNQAIHIATSLKDAKLFCFSANTYHNAGATPAQEIALILASYEFMLNQLANETLSQDTIAALSEFSLTLDADLFGTLSKFRTLRVMIAHIHKARNINVDIPEIHGVMSNRILSYVDQDVNILRASAACFGGVLGGAKTILLNKHNDNPAAITDEEPLSSRIIRNIQLMFQEESHLGHVKDPANGSPYFETLTQELGKYAWRIFQDLMAQGGILNALKNGFIQEMVGKSANERLKQIATRKIPMTGVSEFPNSEEELIALPTQEDIYQPKFDYCLPLSQMNDSLAFLESRHALEKAGVAITLLPIGSHKDYSGRLGFARNLFATIGADIIEASPVNADFELSDDMQLLGYICVCSSDDIYNEYLPKIVDDLQNKNQKVILAGKVPEQHISILQYKLHAEIFIGCDVIALAKSM